jgi:glutamate--cysteine ligase
LLDLARQTLTLSEQGLARRNKLGHGGKDETMYLQPLREIAERGITPAEELLEKFHGPWKGSVEPIFDEYAY